MVKINYNLLKTSILFFRIIFEGFYLHIVLQDLFVKTSIEVRDFVACLAGQGYSLVISIIYINDPNWISDWPHSAYWWALNERSSSSLISSSAPYKQVKPGSLKFAYNIKLQKIQNIDIYLTNNCFKFEKKNFTYLSMLNE